MTVVWRKSRFCSDAACVAVARIDGQVLVRDSKDPDQMPLAFTEAEWSAFLRGAKAGEFDG